MVIFYFLLCKFTSVDANLNWTPTGRGKIGRRCKQTTNKTKPKPTDSVNMVQ